MKQAAGLACAVLLFAAIASAQDAETYEQIWCTTGACFYDGLSCGVYYTDRRDEGDAMATCRVMPSAWRLTYARVADGETTSAELLFPARATCEAMRREAQSYNRAHPAAHRYVALSTCGRVRTVEAPDSDGDGVSNAFDHCPADYAQTDDGCPQEWCYGAGDLVTCAPSRAGCEQARAAEITTTTTCRRI